MRLHVKTMVPVRWWSLKDSSMSVYRMQAAFRLKGLPKGVSTVRVPYTLQADDVSKYYAVDHRTAVTMVNVVQSMTIAIPLLNSRVSVMLIILEDSVKPRL
jgi:hypothetical protein